MTYPSGKILNYNYGSVGSLDDHISRIASLSDSSGTLESYKFLGLSTRIERDRPEPDTRLSYVTGDTLVSGYAGDQYTGLDRFGRIVDQDWQQLNSSGTTVTGHVDRFQYGYDRNGNVVYKDNKVNSSFSELYVTDRSGGADGEYDKLNRLTAFQRGSLSDTNSDGKLDSITASTRAQSWSLDALGNWSSVTTDTNGDTSGGSSTASRTHNGQNQITSGSMTYDADGNTLTGGYRYDGWNRLVQLQQGGGVSIFAYPVDALGRRVLQDDHEVWDPNSLYESDTATDLFYSDRWQVIEDRAVQDLSVDPQTGILRTYVWSPHYVDELVLRERLTIVSSAGGGGGGGGGEALLEDTGNPGDKSSLGVPSGSPWANASVTGNITWTYSRGTIQYVQQDHNYNVTSLTGTTNSATARFVYDPHGTVTYLTAAWGAGSASTSDNFNYLHQGGRWNAVLGLYHFRHREYSSTYGRWMQHDPSSYSDGLNMYQLVRSNPIKWLDALGLEASGPTPPATQPVVVEPVSTVPFDPIAPVRGPIKARRFCSQVYPNFCVVADRWVTDEQAKLALEALERVLGTKRGGQLNMIAAHEGMIVDIILNQTGWNQAPPTKPGIVKIGAPPNRSIPVMTPDGERWARCSYERAIAHGLGHAVAGTMDDGENSMNNIRINENPIIIELGLWPRIRYEKH
jgi:RHS repeat-associated protein